MGVLVTLTFLDGEQSTDFLTDSDLENYLAVGDVKITYIMTGIPDYVITTLNLVSQKQLSEQLSAADYQSLLSQSGQYTPDEIASLVAKYGGNITIGQYVDQFVNHPADVPPSPPAFQSYYDLSVIGTPQFVGNKVIISVQGVQSQAPPSNTSRLQFNIQIRDKITGKITNDDAIITSVTDPANATFNEIVLLSTKDVLVNLYLIDPDNYIQLANPITDLEVLQSQPTPIKTNIQRDLIIGGALFVGVPLGIIAAWKLSQRGKKK